MEQINVLALVCFSYRAHYPLFLKHDSKFQSDCYTKSVSKCIKIAILQNRTHCILFKYKTCLIQDESLGAGILPVSYYKPRSVQFQRGCNSSAQRCAQGRVFQNKTLRLTHWVYQVPISSLQSWADLPPSYPY